MRTLGRHGLACLVILSTAMAGCSRAPAPTYPTWLASPSSTRSATSSANAFDSYTRAAVLEEQAGHDYLTRVYFTPGKRESLIALSQPAIALVRQGTAHPCEFKFEPKRPFAVTPYQRGWGLIGHALVWSIDKACKDGNYDGAISSAVTATRMGFDLTGGGAVDASLGLSIVNEARQSIAPYLSKMGAQQLNTLATGIKAALEAKSPLALTIGNERLNMLAAVQAVQDGYRDNELKPFKKRLGLDVKEAIQYLDDLHARDAKDRPAYFEGFAQEANLQADWDIKLAQVPANQRPPTGPALKANRPWRRLAAQFFHAPDKLIEIDDASVARTKLFILTAEIYRIVKTSKKAPDNLNLFTKTLIIDPYTGLPFMYRADGVDFKVYSVGADFKDDLGDTDASFSKPDLVLEVR